MIGANPALLNREPTKPGDVGIIRAMELRKAAAKAFFDSDCQVALQRALYAGPRQCDIMSQDNWSTFSAEELTHRRRRPIFIGRVPRE